MNILKIYQLEYGLEIDILKKRSNINCLNKKILKMRRNIVLLNLAFIQANFKVSERNQISLYEKEVWSGWLRVSLGLNS